MNAKELAEKLGVHYNTIYKKIKAGDLNAKKIGKSYEVDDIDAYNLIQEKIIKENQIKFFNDYIDRLKIADVEDMFEIEEYLKIFNEEFKNEYRDISKEEIDNSKSILPQLNNLLGIKRFNHYRPSRYLTSQCVKNNYFSDDTLNRFEKLFNDINKLLK